MYIFYICETEVSGLKVDSSSSMGGARCHFFDFGSLFMYEMVQVSPWGDALQQAGSSTALESFWRWKFVEIRLFSLDAI